MGDVGILRKVLLVLQLKRDLISEGLLAREMGWTANAKDLWKRVINEDGDVLIEVMILNESNLYVVDPVYFPEVMEAFYWRSRMRPMRPLRSQGWWM